MGARVSVRLSYPNYLYYTVWCKFQSTWFAPSCLIKILTPEFLSQGCPHKLQIFDRLKRVKIKTFCTTKQVVMLCNM